MSPCPDFSLCLLNFFNSVPPRIAPFTFGDEAMSFGDTASIQCVLSGGDTPISVIWKLNGRPLSNGNDIILEKRGKKFYLLTIESVSFEHIGNYTCSAQNAAGTTEHVAELKVNGLSFRLQILN
jgi:hypothetical protein